ncbi:MAG: lipopolysaccharide biosynthesis protein [Clostridia bacterium]|nr:lipopolysaccharide biosynthesis protein [Clostridia bacterium]
MNEKAKKGLFWRSLESIGVQGMQFVIQLVLARILMPADFGVVAILNIFVNLSNTFVQNGLSSALIQKKDPKKEYFSTVFIIEIALAIVSYFLVFICAPFIAEYYENPDLTLYLRVFALTIVISAFASMQTTILRHKLNFKPSFIANFVGILFQGASGIALALIGFGVWSLIISQVIYRLVAALLLFFYARWIPKGRFSGRSFIELFRFSWKLTVGWIIGTVYQDVFSFVIGKVYDETTLGYYSKGNTIPNVINRVVTQVTTAVMFPVISKTQNDLGAVKKQTREMLAVSAALIFPVMAFVAGAADPMVRLVLTDKWLPAVPIIQIFCISSGINVISNANMQSFNAIGRSDVFLITEVIKRSVTIVIVIILAQIDFYMMLFGIASMGIVSLIINCCFDRKLLNYKVSEYLADLIPSILFGIVLFGAVYVCNFFISKLILRLAVQVIISVIMYTVIAKTKLIKPCTQVWNAMIGLLNKVKA